MGWLIAAAVLILLACVPLGVRIGYDADGFSAYVSVGFVRFRLRLGQKKKKKQPTEKKSGAKNAASGEKSKKGGSISDFLPILDVILDLLWDFRHKLRVKRIELVVILAGGDPCNLAVNYGRSWVALGNLIPALERCFVIQKRDLRVECDFTGDKTRVRGLLELTITVGRLLGLVLRYGWRGLRSFRAIMNQRKGGVVQ